MTHLYWMLPTIVMVGAFLWAIFWPTTCSTWGCWFELITRLLLAFLVSILAWMISAVYR